MGDWGALGARLLAAAWIGGVAEQRVTVRAPRRSLPWPLQAGKQDAYAAVTAEWRAAPAKPTTEAEWRAEEAHAAEVGCGWAVSGEGWAP